MKWTLPASVAPFIAKYGDHPIKWKNLDGVMAAVAEGVTWCVTPLLERIDALERANADLMAAKSLTFADVYRGVWQPGAYERGVIVTQSGSLWLCLRSTTAKPGAGDDWRLIVKRGAAGKDAAQ
jgi:hypothetical protein